MKRYGTILIDPPWPYRTLTAYDRNGGYASRHYKSLSIPDLMRLPINTLGRDVSVVMLWTTWPFIRDGIDLLEYWGYEYRTALAWVKVRSVARERLTFVPSYGVGYWFRGCVEPLLIGSRGGSFRLPYIGLLGPSGQHSRKPESVHLLGRSYPAPRIELFARRTVPGWRCVGYGIDRQSIQKTLRGYE